MNDALIFLVLAGLALVFKWLTSQASGDSEKGAPTSPNERAPRRPPPQSEEERVRRFLEALGAPPGTQPPPPVRPRPVMPRRVVTPAPRPERQSPKVRRGWAQPLPPLTTAPPESVVVEAPPPPVIVAPLLPASAASLPPTVSSARRVAPARVVPRTSLGALLRTRGSIRQAIILREVLGPPRGLEPFGQLQGP